MPINKKVRYAIVEDPGVQASGTIEVAVQPTATNTLTVNGTVITFVAGTAVGSQVQIGANKAATATALLAFLQASTNANIALMTYTKVGDIITAKAIAYRTAGNAYTLATSNAVAFTLSGATLSGGGFSASVISSSTNVSTNRAIWFLRTDSRGLWLNYEGSLTWNGAGDSGATFTVTLPAGYELDSSRIVGLLDGSVAAAAALVGHCLWFDAGVAWFAGSITAHSVPTAVKFVVGSVLVGTSFANGDGLVFKFEAPIKLS